MNHELVKMFKEKLDRITFSDYHGLNSPGLTCYLNSVLQVLFMTEDFREAVKQCCSKDSTTIDLHLRELFADLQKSMARTHDFTKTLGITNVYEQRDAAEYFEKILCQASPEAAKIFKGELNHKITCLECKETNDSRSFFWILPLAVEESRHQPYSVEKGLKAFFKGEKVCGENKMFCTQCNKKRDADFACEMTQNPEILTLLLKRFSFDYKRRCYVKLHCQVDVPQKLHMKNCTYDLYALVKHFGNLTGGHYTAQIKSFETLEWYHFNDCIVEKVKQPLFGDGGKSMRSGTAYLLMYRKVSRNPEKTDEGDQEALWAQSDVEAEERREEAERGETLVLYYQPKDKSYKEAENLKHLNGDIFTNHSDDAIRKKRTNFPRELEKTFERVACVSPHKEIQTDTGADRDGYKPIQSNLAKLRKDGGQKRPEPNRQRLDTNSNEHLRTHHVDHRSQKTRLKANETHWENNFIAKTGMKTTNVTGRNVTRKSVKPAETKPAKSKRDAAAEGSIEGKSKHRKEAGLSANMCHYDVKPCHVSSNGYCSSSVPYLTDHLPSQFRKNEPIGNSPIQCGKSNRSKSNKQKIRHAVAADTTQTVTLGERRSTAKSRDKVKKEPWRG